MEILIDREKIDIEDAKLHNLEEMLLKIMSEKINPKNVITAVKLNGEFYSEKFPHDASRVPIREVKKLEINTMSSEDMAWYFLIKSGDHLDQMVENARMVSELFRVSEESEANEKYAEFVESLRLFWQMVNEVQTILNLDLRTIAFQEGTVEDRVQKLSGLMDQMIKVQEEEDWVMLADLLNYELIPLLQEWKEIINLLKGRRAN
jgi:hypothetical protein